MHRQIAVLELRVVGQVVLVVMALLPYSSGFSDALTAALSRGAWAPRPCRQRGAASAAPRMNDGGARGRDIHTPEQRVQAMGVPMQVGVVSARSDATDAHQKHALQVCARKKPATLSCNKV